MTDKERIGACLVAIRKEMKATQQKFAELTGFPQSTIAKIEKGRYNMSIDVLSDLLRSIGYEINITKTPHLP